MPPPPVWMTSDEYENEPVKPILSVVSFLSATRNLIFTLLGVVVVLGALAFFFYHKGEVRGYERGRGVLLSELARDSAVIDSLKRAKQEQLVRYERDTVWLRQMVTVYRNTTDTLWRDSVVYVRKDVADAALNACMATLKDCDALRVTNDSLVSVMDSLRVPVEKRDRLQGYGVALYEPWTKAVAVRAGGQLNLTRHWSLMVELSRRLVQSDTARFAAGFKGTF